MKILLIGNYINDRQVSIEHCIRVLETGFKNIASEVRMIRPEPVFGKIKPSVQGVGKWLGYIDKFLLFPSNLKKNLDWADVVCICDQSFSHYTKYLQNKPHVVICHDILNIKTAVGEINYINIPWTGQQYQKIILKGLSQACHVACSSLATQTDVMRICKVPAERTTVVELCLDYGYAKIPREEAIATVSKFNLNLDNPFILHVGGNQWYKNRLGVLKIFNHLRNLPGMENLRLVMVGKEFTESMNQFIAENEELAQKLTKLVAISDEELRAIYSLATGLIFPSLLEGFGLPVIEAQFYETVIFTSNRSPMKDVGGEGAIYFDPEQPQAAAEIVANALKSPELMQEMREKGLKNVAKFTVENMIKSYYNVFEKVYSKFANEEGK